ncbi:MAG: metallophosphoesterase [bacterium]
MAIAPLLIRMLERQGLGFLARLLAYLGYTWLGILFLFLCTSLLLDLIRLVLSLVGLTWNNKSSGLSISSRAALFLPLLLSAALAVVGYFEALDIQTEKVVFQSPKIPKEMGWIKVAQISDVHLGLIVRERRLERILRPVREFAPDILVSTGDLMDGQANDLSGIAERLQGMVPRYGKFAVTGNHEYYAGINQSLQFLERAGFSVLRGNKAEVAGISIVGVDDLAEGYFGPSPHASESELLSRVPPGRFVLFLKHQPLVEKSTLGLFDLQLSGHTHKGQIFPFSLLTHLYYRLDSGWLNSGGSYLHVSNGSGTWGPPIRLLAPAEVTLIELGHGETTRVSISTRGPS